MIEFDQQPPSVTARELASWIDNMASNANPNKEYLVGMLRAIAHGAEAVERTAKRAGKMDAAERAAFVRGHEMRMAADVKIAGLQQ